MSNYLRALIETIGHSDDKKPPKPATFADVTAHGGSSIVMRAEEASDDAILVEYYFDELLDEEDDHDSGWQLSPLYAAIGLTPTTTYAFNVRVRDRFGNESEPSDTIEVTTEKTDDLCHTPFIEDKDCDWIEDSKEFPGDFDSDGIPNIDDSDDDNDSLETKSEYEDSLIVGSDDPDGDGMPSWYDLDSDDDGIPDSFDGAGDEDGDGLPNSVDPS